MDDWYSCLKVKQLVLLILKFLANLMVLSNFYTRKAWKHPFSVGAKSPVTAVKWLIYIYVISKSVRAIKKSLIQHYGVTLTWKWCFAAEVKDTSRTSVVTDHITSSTSINVTSESSITNFCQNEQLDDFYPNSGLTSTRALLHITFLMDNSCGGTQLKHLRWHHPCHNNDNCLIVRRGLLMDILQRLVSCTLHKASCWRHC